MPFANLQGVRLYYEVHGSKKNSNNYLVLIEGFACNRLVWEAFLPSFTEDFHVVVFDNRGSGQSDSPEGVYSIETMAKDTVALMDQLGISQAHMMGHSMGGMILQQICLDFPQKVAKAILCATSAKVPEKALMQNEVISLFRKMGVAKELMLRNFFPWLLSNAFLSDKRQVEDLLQKMSQDPYPQTLDGYQAQAAALRSFNLEERVKRIKNPTLIIGGEEDLLIPFTCSEFLSRQIPHAQLIKLPGQAHFFIEEMSEEVLKIAKNFLLN